MNPVIEGLYADPDLIKVNDKYYIYPTTDGYDGWGGYCFSVFESDDLTSFKNKGEIINFHKGDVKWAKECAWAPCMLFINNTFYFYFCGKREDGVSCIGAAYSQSPTGPFQAAGEPVITPELVRECGIQIGQTIDPSVYVENGKAYLLFGNGNPVIAELADDYMGVKKETMRAIDGAYDFREAITVFKKDDKYHFTWSCDDTGSENYHINYGVSDSLYGPIEFQYPILKRKEEDDILGTGHHSILRDENKYYIAYHRFGTPLSKYPDGKGFHRETCIDELTFNEEGLIVQVTPTR